MDEIKTEEVTPEIVSNDPAPEVKEVSEDQVVEVPSEPAEEVVVPEEPVI